MASPEQTDTVEQQNATGVGALLKASRLRIGEELRDIAGILKIRHVYLEAIEDGRFEDLPGTTYTLGFVRAYAEHLGLDSGEVIRRFKSQESDVDPRSQLDFPEPIPEASVPGGAIIFIGVVVAVLAYGAWYMNSSEDGFFKDLIAPLPDRFAKMAGEPKTGKKAETEKADPEKPDAEKAEPTEPAQEPPPAQSQPETAQQPKPAETPKPLTEPVTEPADEPKPEKIAETTPEATPQTTSDTPSGTASQSTPATPPENAEAPVPEKTPVVASAEVSEPKPTSTPTSTPTSPTASEPSSSSQPSAAPETVATPAPVVEPVRAPSVVPMDMIPSAASTAVEPTPPVETAPTPAPVSTSDDAAETQTASTTPETTPETPKPKPAAEQASRIIVRAKTNSWIQVRDDTANELLLTRLLRAGDSYTVPGRSGLMLSTGNAGALEILVDGKAVPPIGAEGVVRRKILLDADKLKAGTAVSE